ncbi:MAG: hypothetical protein H6741_24235 [Alphaproteobacteria bacterium]|nr:hypothetical protein [Alphaproteobacteria bacterium]
MNSLIAFLVWILLALGVASTPSEALALLFSAEEVSASTGGPAGEPVHQTHTYRKSAGPQGSPSNADTDGIFNGI